MEAMKRVKVYSAGEKLQADMLVEMLKRNQIAAYRQGRGSGGYMDIYAGNSIYGEDIYVDEADKEEAARLIQEMTAEVETDPDTEPDTEQKNSSRYTKGQMMAGRIVLIILCAAILFSIVNSLL